MAVPRDEAGDVASATVDPGCEAVCDIWRDFVGEPVCFVMPSFSPRGAVEMIEHNKRQDSGIPTSSKDEPVMFLGDGYATHFVMGVLHALQNSPSKSETKYFTQTLLSMEEGERNKVLSSNNLVLIGSPRSNWLTEEALKRLVERGLVEKDPFPDALDSNKSIQRITTLSGDGYWEPHVENGDKWLLDVGYAGKFPNPWAAPGDDLRMVILAGSGYFGTQAAGAAITTAETAAALIEGNGSDRILQGTLMVVGGNTKRLDGYPAGSAVNGLEPLRYSNAEEFQVYLLEPQFEGPVTNSASVVASTLRLGNLSALRKTIFSHKKFNRVIRDKKRLRKVGIVFNGAVMAVCLLAAIISFVSDPPRLSLFPWPLAMIVGCLFGNEMIVNIVKKH